MKVTSVNNAGSFSWVITGIILPEMKPTGGGWWAGPRWFWFSGALSSQPWASVAQMSETQHCKQQTLIHQSLKAGKSTIKGPSEDPWFVDMASSCVHTRCRQL